jgi:DNA-binding NtrC family response regulator
MARILALTPDLFFSTRISSALKLADHAVRIVDSDDSELIDEALFALNPALVILDIGAAGVWNWQSILTQLREASPDTPVLCYGSHMDVEATQTAKELGAVRVVARSEFVNNMGNLVERYKREESGE